MGLIAPLGMWRCELKRGLCHLLDWRARGGLMEIYGRQGGDILADAERDFASGDGRLFIWKTLDLNGLWLCPLYPSHQLNKLVRVRVWVMNDEKQKNKTLNTKEHGGN